VVLMPRWTTALLVVCLVAGGGWASHPPFARAQAVHLGSGARFLPADTAFYLAGNLGPQSPQLPYLDRLTRFYIEAPEVDAAQRELSQGLKPFGPYTDLRELWSDASPWLGDEAFLAFRSSEDLMSAGGVSSRVAPECRDPQMLAGMAIGDQGEFRAFLERYDHSLQERGIQRATEQVAGTDVLVIGGSPEGGNVFAAVTDGYLLVSTSQPLLSDALAGHLDGGLAGTTSFQRAMSHAGPDPLALMYVNAPDQTLRFGGGGLYQEGATTWLLGTLNLRADSVQVDIASALDPTRLTSAGRDLFGKHPNPLQSTTVVPRQTSFFVGWDNLQLIWQAIKAQIGPESYASGKREFMEATDLDPDADIFDWMTGEFATFTMPSGDEQTMLGRLGLGVLIQARDPVLAREKLDKALKAVRKVAPDLPLSLENIGGVDFQRIRLTEHQSLYVQVVDNWLFVGSSTGVAANTLAALKGDGGLQTQTEAQVIRAGLPDSTQFLGYVNMPEFVAISTSGVGAAGSNADETEQLSQPIRSVGLAVQTTPDLIEGRFLAHVSVPDAIGAPARAEPAPASYYGAAVLIDASKHGGAWWGPDEQPRPLSARSADPDTGPLLPGRGAPLLRLLHDEAGVENLDTLLPGQHLAQPPSSEDSSRLGPRAPEGVFYPSGPLIVRVGSDGAYEPDEITAYQEYVRCGGRVVLLADGLPPGQTDELAQAFGMQVAGTIRGPGRISAFAPHPLTEGAEPLSAPGGTGLVSWDTTTVPLAFYSPATYLDLGGGSGVSGAPAMAVRPYGRGSVVFLGTTSVVEYPDQPLMRHLLMQLLPQAPWRGPILADQFEPDDTPLEATPLFDASDAWHSLDSPADVDWYSFSGQAGERLVVYQRRGCSLQMSVFDTDGETELTHGQGFMLNYTLPASGDYLLRVAPGGRPWDTCREYSLIGQLI
jgi:uncharacterized protein DUF3352